MKHRVILALILSVCTLGAVLGQTTTQTPPQASKPADDKDDVVKITTNLVQVDAVVTKDGKPVSNLKAEDFEIYEDGNKQTITSFAYISNVSASASTAPDNKGADAPLVPGPPAAPIKRDVSRRTIAIVVDDLGLSAESMSQVRRQVRKFIAEQIDPNDLVAIIRTGGEMGALQQFTNDKRMLNRAAEQLRWNVCSRVGVSVFNRSNVPYVPGDERDPCDGYSYRNTQKALHFILDAMAQLPGRKSLILMSDSMPIENQETTFSRDDAVFVKTDVTNYASALRKIAEKAIRSSVVIYSVDTQGLQYGSAPASGPENAIDKEALARIKAPVYGFYAGNDARINATLPASSQAMTELKKTFEPVTYEGSGHGFMRAGDAPEPAAPEAKGDAAADEKAKADYDKALAAWKGNKKARDEAWVRWKKLLAAV